MTGSKLLGALLMLLVVLQPVMGTGHDAPVIDIGSRLELFVDDSLIDQLQGAQLRLNHPVDAGVAIKFDRPWEGAFSGCVTVIKDGPAYRLYCRCLPIAGKDGNENEATCYAESMDGIQWTQPELEIYELMGTRKNNAVLAHSPPFTHNFSPLLDTRPGVPTAERFKALGGTKPSGLVVSCTASTTGCWATRRSAAARRGTGSEESPAGTRSGEDDCDDHGSGDTGRSDEAAEVDVAEFG